MNGMISPKYQMQLIKSVKDALWAEYGSYKDVYFYIKKWQVVNEEWNNYSENFKIEVNQKNEIDLLSTLNNFDSDTLLKIAIDLGVDTPDFIPSISTFRNEIKASYETASATFERAFKQIEEHPDTAIGLANSALESIIKEILKDERISSKISGKETLYALTSIILKEFQFTSEGDMPKEIKTMGSSLIAINQSIEKLRSEKTSFHGKTNADYVIKDPIYTYFIVNSVATVGLFLNSFYRKKYPQKEITNQSSIIDDLPF